jgi:AcrR family transcriptional regulator
MPLRVAHQSPHSPRARASGVRRRAGRPAALEPGGLRERILVAAGGEFARAGLGGARVERIASEAGVNVRMLYYYFGSKDELFVAVLENVYAGIRQAERTLELERAEPVEAMRRLVRFS